MWLKSSTTIEKTQSNTKGNTPPEYPTVHQQWIDTSGEKPILKEWDGNEWIAVESDVTKLDPHFTNDITEKLKEAHNSASNALEDATNAIEKAELLADDVLKNTNTIKNFKDETGQKITEIQGSVDGLAMKFNDVNGQIGQITTSVNGITTQFNNYKTATDTKFNVVDGSINGMIKKGDLISQFNMEAGKTLINSSKQMVLSSENIIFDSANPVQIPSSVMTKSLIGSNMKIDLDNSEIISWNNNNTGIRLNGEGLFFGNDYQAGIYSYGIHYNHNSLFINQDENPEAMGINLQSSDYGFVGNHNKSIMFYDNPIYDTDRGVVIESDDNIIFRYDALNDNRHIEYFRGSLSKLSLNHSNVIETKTNNASQQITNNTISNRVSTSTEELGTSWKNIVIEGNKTLDIHKDYIGITFGGVVRKLKKGTLPDGTATIFFGTTDDKSGIHITGGNVYLELNGSTYGFDTKYLKKL